MIIVAGPCAVESAVLTEESAQFLSSLGVQFLRGGAFKPRTRPDSFQGLGLEGWRILRRAADAHGMRVVSEVTDIRLMDAACNFVDVLQIGARNAQNYDLLRACNDTQKPILLKRGLAMTLDEWEGAAGYLQDCPRLWLCERGHRTYMPHVRFMLDVAAIGEMKRRGFTVIADPSHAAGERKFVLPLARAAIAARADGLIVEVHPCPERAMCDAAQQLAHPEFRELWAWLEG